MYQFVEEKWGDIVGLFLIVAGVALVICAPAAKDLGESAFCAGLAVLKLQLPTRPETPPADTHAVRPPNIAGPGTPTGPVPPSIGTG